MKELPVVYRLAFAVGFIWLAFHYGRREIAPESGPCETVPSNPPSAIQENSKPHPEQLPATIPGPVEAMTASRSETKSPGKETVSEPRPVPAPQPLIRVVQVLGDDRMVIECHPNGSFLARGSIKRMPDGRDGRWVQDGIWTNYWPRGAVSSVGEWKEGTQVGPWLFASEDGRSTVTNHPPFASAVAKPTVSTSSTVVAESDQVTGEPPVAAPVAAVLRQAQDSPEQSRGAASGDPHDGGPSGVANDRRSASASAPPGQLPARKTDPDLFVCGKHDSDPYLRDADALFLRGEWKRAKTSFADYADQHLNAPERPYAMLQKAVCDERMGKLPEARAGYQDYLRVFGREECGAKGQAGLAALLWKQPSSRTLAIAEYEKLIKNYPKAPEAATALKLLGDHYLAQREYAKARDCFENHLARFPNATDRQEVETRLETAQIAGESKDKMGLAGSSGFDQAVAGAEELYARGRYREASQLYNELLARFGGSPSSASYCLMQIGLCHLATQEYAPAQTRFRLLVTKYPSAEEAPEAAWRYVQTAYCLLHQPREVEAMAQQLLEKYPGTFQAQKADFIRGLQMEKRAKAQAHGYWTQFLARWPQTAYLEMIQQRLARYSPAPSAITRLGDNR